MCYIWLIAIDVVVNIFWHCRMFRKDEVGYSPEQLPPPGEIRPMCWCGDECCFQTSDDWDTYGQRYWMCRNYAYSAEKPKVVPKGKKGKAKKPVEVK